MSTFEDLENLTNELSGQKPINHNPQNSAEYLEKEIRQAEFILGHKKKELEDCNLQIELLTNKIVYLTELKNLLPE